ncbi:MAG: hypothetical protein EPO51_16610 [Phenylobacterium sp.]|uniref:hypothetical protein n=1 Tax=Phenylobacterium sp. TaxID=1871053 RepID=UPI00121A144D|nr:hypothetical protein [Phenylobacterium sp.]TAJ70710.1 MAG: hypothetical protein EPO51_16610 [Phenylobacterium sp.]
MSLKLSGSHSKTKTTSNSTSNSTTTPIAPEWASSLTQGVAGRVNSLMGLDPNSLVAPAHALQNQAASGAANLNSSGDPSWLAPYMNADTPFASGGKAYDYVDRYLNPYLKEVVDSSAADFDFNAGNVRAQQALDLAGAGAFGGSGAALTQSMTEGELARGRASTLSGLRSKGYETALGAAAGDAERATQARIANAQTALQDRAQKAGFGFQAGENQRANIAAQAGLGGTLRDIDQQQRQAPVSNTQQLVAMLSGLPIGLFTGEQKTGAESSVGTGKTTTVGFEASKPA